MTQRDTTPVATRATRTHTLSCILSKTSQYTVLYIVLTQELIQYYFNFSEGARSHSALHAALLDTGREHGKTRTGQVIQMRATGIGQAIHIAQLKAMVEISIGVLKPIHRWRVHEMRTLLPPPS